MTGTTLAWAAVGMAAGGAHAAALWRAARRIPASGYGGGLRLVIVFAVLVGAAYVGVLPSFAAGWTSGLLVTSVLYVGAERWKT